MAGKLYEHEFDVARGSQDDNDDIEKILNDEDFKMKPQCECKHCKHWSTSTNWARVEDYIFADTKCTKTTIKQTTTDQQTLLLFNEGGYNSECFDTKTMETLNDRHCWKDKKILVHGPTIPTPVNHVNRMKLHETVMSALKRFDYHEPKITQSFLWPCIEQNLNCLLIDNPRSGKTLCYLLGIVSKILENRQNGIMTILQKHKGPTCVILCPTIKECEDIYDLCKKFNIIRQCRVYQLSNPFSEIRFDIDIMLTTPPILVERLQKRAFTLKKLCYFIIENGSLLMDLYKQQMIILFNLINNVLEHRSVQQLVQLIIVSTKWTTDLRMIIEKLNQSPIVCIGNNLEASLYGGIKFNVDIMKSELKKQRLAEIIKDKWSDYRIIVFCENDEIRALNLWLKLNRIDTITILEDLEPEKKELKWTNLTKNDYKVLICTDTVFNQSLNIDNAMLLIHYSFPETWTRFTKRFLSISRNLKSPIIKNKENSECTTYLFIDESCTPQLPKIFGLLSRLDGIPDKVQSYLTAFRSDGEQQKLQRNIQLCPQLKLLGDCLNNDCQKRHIVDEACDITKEQLPENGVIKFVILKLLDTTTFLVQIREYIDLNGNHIKYNQNQFNISNNQIDDENDPIRSKSIKIDQICSYQSKTNLLLCKIIEILNESFVKIQIYDNEEVCCCRVDDLYQIPEDFKVVEVMLANLIPQYNDTHFSNQTYQILKARLNRYKYETIVWTGTIQLQLSQTLWLNDVAQKLYVLKQQIVKLDLIKLMKELNLVEFDRKQIENLRALCTNSNIILPQYCKPKINNNNEDKEMKLEAFLDDHHVNLVHFVSGIDPNEFYVRLEKFDKLLENLEKDITIDVRKGLYDLTTDDKVIVGNFYTTLEPDGRNNDNDRYTRVQILNHTDNHVLCYSVDYGDEFLCDFEQIKKLPEKYRYRLPFQAIQCSLQGVLPPNGDNNNDWDGGNGAIDLIYDHFMWLNDDDDDNDRYRTLYLKVCDRIETKQEFRTNYKYIVLLQDERNDGPILINRYLVDQNVAINGGIEEFDLETIETIKTNDDDDNNKDAGIVDDEFKDFELFTDNLDQFIEMMIPEQIREKLLPLITPNYQQALGTSPSVAQPAETNEQQQQQQGSASFTIPADDKPPACTPDIYWSQTNEFIRIRIRLIGVQKYSCRIIKRHHFVFKTNVDGRNYEAKFLLNNTAEIVQHSAKGLEVVVLLKKFNTPQEWLQLTSGKTRYTNIHYEISDKDLDGYDKQPKKRILQLDISDSDSESDNDDDSEGRMYVVESDLDSDYDHDIASSSSED